VGIVIREDADRRQAVDPRNVVTFAAPDAFFR
jgi:hypothetical protein